MAEIKALIRCQIDAGTGEVFVQQSLEALFSPGTQFSGLGTTMRVKNCANGTAITPQINMLRTRLRERGTGSALSNRTEIRVCDMSNGCSLSNPELVQCINGETVINIP